MFAPFTPRLRRPLAALDIATTGPAVKFDRIVEITVVEFTPDGGRVRLVHRLNPAIPIPPSATALHHISDQDVVRCPFFETIAGGLDQFLRDCDLCGSGLRQVALPMLVAEFSRAGIRFSLRNRAIIDVAHLNHSRETQDLVVLAVSAVLDALLAKSSENFVITHLHR